MGDWKAIDHTADVALRIQATSLPDLFETAAHGMFALCAEMDVTQPEITLSVALIALDAETLLVDWLNELLYLAERESCAFTRYDFAVCTSTQLQATVYGYPITAYLTYIKAATFHNLAIRVTADGYATEIVLDT